MSRFGISWAEHGGRKASRRRVFKRGDFLDLFPWAIRSRSFWHSFEDQLGGIVKRVARMLEAGRAFGGFQEGLGAVAKEELV